MNGVPSGLVPLAVALSRLCPSYAAFEAAHLYALANGATSTWITSDRASVDSLFGVGPIEYGARRLDAAAKRFNVGLEVLLEASFQFRCGAWIAYGRPCYAQSGALGEVQCVPADLWMLGLSIDQASSMVAFPPGVTFSSVQCAPLLLCGNAGLVEQSLAGMSLQSVIDRFVFGDFESHVLYSTHRNGTAPENFAGAFSKATAQGVQLPLSDKSTIAAELLPIIAPLVTANAEAIADVLARRFDALAFYLETLHVTWGGATEPVLLGKGLQRATALLNLSDFGIVSGDDPSKELANICFALPPEPASIEKLARGSYVTNPPEWGNRLRVLFDKDDSQIAGLDTDIKVFEALAADAIKQKGIENVRGKDESGQSETDKGVLKRFTKNARDGINGSRASKVLLKELIARAKAPSLKASS